MSTSENSDNVKNSTVNVRFPDRLRERVERLVDADEYETRSELVREATRRLVLDAEVRERLDDEDVDGGELA